MTAFSAANKMPRHAKAWKFKRLLSQNEEPFAVVSHETQKSRQFLSLNFGDVM